MYLVTDLKSERTFVLEPTRRGSSKLHAWAMTARGRDLDVRIPHHSVPLYIRRAAREVYPDIRGRKAGP